MNEKIIKYGFREGLFGKQILQVLIEATNYSYIDVEYQFEKWRDATRDEANQAYAKLNPNE